jgi:hypothetical protein
MGNRDCRLDEGSLVLPIILLQQNQLVISQWGLYKNILSMGGHKGLTLDSKKRPNFEKRNKQEKVILAKSRVVRGIPD